MPIRFVRVAGVRIPCVTLAEAMRVVAVAAFACLLCRFWEFVAGGMVMSVFVLVGAMAMLGGRARTFWRGFVAIGVPLLVAYLVVHGLLFVRVVVPWANFVFRGLDLLAARLPQEFFHEYYKYFYMNPRATMTAAEVIALQEVSFGLPMLLLGAAGG